MTDSGVGAVVPVVDVDQWSHAEPLGKSRVFSKDRVCKFEQRFPIDRGYARLFLPYFSAIFEKFGIKFWKKIVGFWTNLCKFHQKSRIFMGNLDF